LSVTDRKLEGYQAEFPAGADASEPHIHEGPELVYVLRASLFISIDGTEHVLNAAYSIYFEPTVPRATARAVSRAAFQHVSSSRIVL
jgi:quercetin dioxygenase-like cupin family protein